MSKASRLGKELSKKAGACIYCKLPAPRVAKWVIACNNSPAKQEYLIPICNTCRRLRGKLTHEEFVAKLTHSTPTATSTNA